MQSLRQTLSLNVELRCPWPIFQYSILKTSGNEAIMWVTNAAACGEIQRRRKDRTRELT